MSKILNNGTVNSNNNNLGGAFMMNGTIGNMKDFAETIKVAAELILGRECEVEIKEVLKNNDTCLTGLVIRGQESNMAPTIYLEGFYKSYEEGESLSSIIDEIVRVYEEHKVGCEFDVSVVTDFEKAKEKICYRLINADRNAQLLQGVPHVIVCDDLAVVFYILVSSDREGTATITIRNDMADMWHTTTDELFAIALSNTMRLFRGSVLSMSRVMMEMLEDRLDEEDIKEFYDMVVSNEDMIPMYVCTNASKLNGAGVLLYKDLLKEFAERTGSDFYILPSSIHETLLVPVSDQIQVENLRAMVREVNETQVAPEEVLSDQVYIYRRSTEKICLA